MEHLTEEKPFGFSLREPFHFREQSLRHEELALSEAIFWKRKRK
jgi:hypothetical protein